MLCIYRNRERDDAFATSRAAPPSPRTTLALSRAVSREHGPGRLAIRQRAQAAAGKPLDAVVLGDRGGAPCSRQLTRPAMTGSARKAQVGHVAPAQQPPSDASSGDRILRLPHLRARRVFAKPRAHGFALRRGAQEYQKRNASDSSCVLQRAHIVSSSVAGLEKLQVATVGSPRPRDNVGAETRLASRARAGCAGDWAHSCRLAKRPYASPMTSTVYACCSMACTLHLHGDRRNPWPQHADYWS